jgi:glyoxylase-like metal-dependent hydrolase (beta-lactamase superfamily II)
VFGQCALAAAPDFVASTVPMELIKVAPHTWYVRGQAGMISPANQGFNSNAGFVVTKEGVVVFDVLGTPGLGAALLAQIRKVTQAPIRKIVISHYHSDHFYGLAALKASGPVEVIAHREVRDYLATSAPAERLAERRQSLAPWVDGRTTAIAPDRYLAEPVSGFKLGGMTFTILHAGPAHTAEDMMMLVEEEGVLFAGDVIFSGRIPFVGDADITPWLGAIERLAAARPAVMVAGHGVHSTDAAADLALTRDYLTFLRKTMRAAVEKGDDFEDAYRATDWSAFSKLPAFEAANHKNAFSAYLTAEREALARVPDSAGRPQ